MSTNLKIEDLFEKDIRRDVDGVIKVDKYDDQSVFTELDEYVVTNESRKHFDKFFDRYYNATQTPTDKIGVWISGFFGSGKSHFIKILSYLLENRTVFDKPSLSFFENKINDPQMFSTIEKSVKYGTKDAILFNIDSKANAASIEKERIVNILMRAFNEKRGFFGEVFWIAELEEDMHDKGLYDTFKEEFKKINGGTWEEVRDQYTFEQDDIIEALTNCRYQSREASVRMFENDGRNYHLDEAGQYIGEDSELMLNLQTVVEELGTKLRGKAWVIVTSQADIDTAAKEQVKGRDFSKIQARFDTRLSLSSANVDEVIKKRILAKKEEHMEMLASFYTDKKIILKNLISFSRGSADMKNYKEEEDFVEYCESGVGVIVPFHLFYNTIESFLDPIITRTITQAEKNDKIKDNDCDILRTLFMIRHVKEIQPTLENLVALSISNVDEDKLKLKEKVAESLRRLEEQTLISKSGDSFYFLTNEEQEINREIKNIDIEKHSILDDIYEVVFNSNEICPTKYMDYKFNRAVDDRIKTLANADLTIKFLTPLFDEMLRGSGQRSLHGDNLSKAIATI
jgi:hypothetical protein